jgi:hypothetical protein
LVVESVASDLASRVNRHAKRLHWAPVVIQSPQQPPPDSGSVRRELAAGLPDAAGFNGCEVADNRYSLAVPEPAMEVSNLERGERLFYRDRLRSARYAALADAEGFQEICYAVEGLGMRLLGSEATLSKYKPAIERLARSTTLFELSAKFPMFFTRFDALYETLRRARNDAMHVGSYARHATAAAVELCIGLEEAIMNVIQTPTTVADYMVKSPVSIEHWQPVAHARQLMLMYSFSNLPVIYDGQWKLLSEMAVVAFLQPKLRAERGRALAQSISDAVTLGLKLLPAKTLRPTAAISTLVAKSSIRPVPTLWLVVEGKNRLTGVLSPFELM